MYTDDLQGNYRAVRARLMGAEPTHVAAPRIDPVAAAKAKMRKIIEECEAPTDDKSYRRLKFSIMPPEDDKERLLDDIADDTQPWGVHLSNILATYDETMVRVRSKHRDVRIVEVRRIIARMLRRRGWTYPEIGKMMAKDHTSVISLLHPEKRREKHVRQRAVAARAHAAHEANINTSVAVLGPDGRYHYEGK